ncbi:superoxide dismutase [Clostridium sartagoforme]|uniref:Superoxide dismutase n=1 Tax=Clostridium sartagoforme TaxID=84031 RepID=A0A4S2DNX1_9CLOT|nr:MULTISPECIES: superoxide dismutase [Clostridium]MBS5939659.1 superoxide dismutase [Clostridium sp.]TGY42783.1 superoxide dismutase [Clostridium sartagoforme]
MYKRIELPYDFNSLEPYIDEATMRTHYGKHHLAYETNLNKALENNEEYTKGKTLEQLLKNIDELPEGIKTAVVNNGGGVSNHNLYFSILSPNAKKTPEGKLLEAINKTFGSVDNLKEELNNASISIFGSGFAFLVKDKEGNLSIVKRPNQNSPAMDGLVPVIAVDVWEHAYYLNYKNLRADYVKNIWNVIDWGKVEELYEEDYNI